MINKETKTKFTFRVVEPFYDMGEEINKSEVVTDSLDKAKEILVNSYEGVDINNFQLVKTEDIELYDPQKKTSLEYMEDFESFKYFEIGNYFDKDFNNKKRVVK
jgi:hypothetical protein